MKTYTKKIKEAGELTVFSTDLFKVGTLCVFVTLPIETSKVAVQKLLLPVLCRGTEKYPNQSLIDRRLDYLYSADIDCFLRALGDVKTFGLRASFLNDAFTSHDADLLGGVTEMIQQLLFSPVKGKDGAFLQEYIDGEKKIISDAVSSAEKSPRSYSFRRCRELLSDGKDEVLSFTPLQMKSDLDGVGQDALVAEHCRIFGTPVSDNPTEREGGFPLQFLYTGNEDPEKVAAYLENAFGGYRAKSYTAPLPSLFSRDRDCDGETCVSVGEESMPVSQARLVMACCTGVQVPDGDFYAMMIANEIFGVSPISRLFVNVREKKSLCYSCSSLYDAFRGILYVSCGIKNDNREAAENAILAEFEAMKKGEFTDAELSAAKQSLFHVYRQLTDEPTGISDYSVGRRIFNAGTTVEETVERLGAVTREQVISVFEKIRPDAIFFLRGDGVSEGEDCDDE